LFLIFSTAAAATAINAKMTKTTKINTILFDCDNTLVLSEKLAFEACANLANEILSSRNPPIDKTYTGPELLATFVGQNFRGMILNLQKLHGFTLDPEELESYVLKEEDRVIAKLEEKAESCIGVDEELELLTSPDYQPKYTLAVVSSSALRRVKASIKKVNQCRFFPENSIFSAATSLPQPTSKPDPAIYIHACKELDKKMEECVAVEDSKSGTLSAVRAGIRVIGYVGSYDSKEERKEMRKVLAAAGAGVIMDEWSEFQQALKDVEELDQAEEKL